ncbi:MAG: hypothetical protein IPN83_15905 [Holophagales bacterium]|jgi:hypothetical protein|nr:hypothetical protein [Holophagales bacterium]
MLRLMDDEEEPSCLDEPARRLLREARDNFVRMGLGTRRLVRSGSTTHPPEALAAAVLNKESEKYDGFLDESLLSAEYARRNLDAEGEWRAVESIVRSGEGDP